MSRILASSLSCVNDYLSHARYRFGVVADTPLVRVRSGRVLQTKALKEEWGIAEDGSAMICGGAWHFGAAFYRLSARTRSTGAVLTWCPPVKGQ